MKTNLDTENKNRTFWDGFQWVTRQQQTFDSSRSNAEKAQFQITGEDQQKHEERLAASRTVIIENLALDLGLTAKDIQKFLLDQLNRIGVTDVKIVDIDMKHGPSSIAVEL